MASLPVNVGDRIGLIINAPLTAYTNIGFNAGVLYSPT